MSPPQVLVRLKLDADLRSAHLTRMAPTVAPSLQLHPALHLDPRAGVEAVQSRQIFESFLYRIFVALHAPSASHTAHLLAAQIHFQQEAMAVLLPLADLPIAPAWNEVTALLRALEQEQGRGPYGLIREAKVALAIPFTMNDRAAFRLAGLDLPRPPKSFWEDPS